jgi:serine protease Do
MSTMRHAARRFGLVVVALIIGSSGAATEAQAQYSRRTPIVEAVQKTRAGIVSVRVTVTDATGRERERVGTGIVVDERGYVITSLHVVITANTIRVHLIDGSAWTAQLLKEDARCDLAILRIQPGKKLQALPLGPAHDLLIGETVIAVGHPFGYNHTVSTGIVSAVGREITLPSGETLPNLIQTNASINPGNSGGPLLNITGSAVPADECAGNRWGAARVSLRGNRRCRRNPASARPGRGSGPANTRGRGGTEAGR